MFRFESSYIAYCRNNIKTYGHIYAKMFYVSIGGYDNTAYFLPIDGILRLDILCIASGFHFDDNQLIVFGRDDIQFQMVLPPVPVAYLVSVTLQIGCCRIFSSITHSIMYCHSTIFFLSVQKYVFSALFLQK